MKKRNYRRSRPRSRNPNLPELEQARSAVLNSLGSPQSQRTYGRAMEEFILWYCSEPRLALSRSVVLHYLERDTAHGYTGQHGAERSRKPLSV